MSHPTRPPRGTRPARLARLALAVVASGLAAGAVGVAMAYLLDGFEWLFYGSRSGSLPERVTAAPAWRQVAAPLAAGVLAGALWWWERATGGVVSVEQVVGEQTAPTPPAAPSSPARGLAPGSVAGRMGLRRPFADAVIQVLTVGGGNSVGREGAPRLAAGAVAVRLSARLGIERDWVAPLTAAAAGAGLAAMYNAPLGGAAYAVELLLPASSRRRGLLLALPVSVIATMVSWLHSHRAASVLMGPAGRQAPSLTTGLGLVLTVLLAAVAGRLAASGWAGARRHQVRRLWLLPLAIGGAGALTGAASCWLPILPGNGRDAFQAAVSSPTALAALAPMLGVVLLKPVLTGLTLGAGATGGLLAPSFSLGACTGTAVAIALATTGASASLPVLALVGAGVTLAVTQKAPVFAALFVWEIVQGPVWCVPVLLLACALSARLAYPRSA